MIIVSFDAFCHERVNLTPLIIIILSYTRCSKDHKG